MSMSSESEFEGRKMTLYELVQEAEDVSPEIKNLVSELYEIQSKQTQLEEEMNEKIFKLKAEYHKKCEGLYQEISKLSQSVTKKGDVKYWKNVLMSHNELEDDIQITDYEALESLVDVRCHFVSRDSVHPRYSQFKETGFILEFEFDENEFFTNRILYKYLKIDFKMTPDERLEYKNMKCVDIVCSEVDWKEGKNLTKKISPKPMMNEDNGKLETKMEEEISDSFFNFFQTPDYLLQNKLDNIQCDEDFAIYFQADMDLAVVFIEDLIPHSSLYFADSLVAHENDFSGLEDLDDMDEDEFDYDEDLTDESGPSTSSANEERRKLESEIIQKMMKLKNQRKDNMPKSQSKRK